MSTFHPECFFLPSLEAKMMKHLFLSLVLYHAEQIKRKYPYTIHTAGEHFHKQARYGDAL